MDVGSHSRTIKIFVSYFFHLLPLFYFILVVLIIFTSPVVHHTIHLKFD